MDYSPRGPKELEKTEATRRAYMHAYSLELVSVGLEHLELF